MRSLAPILLSCLVTPALARPEPTRFTLTLPDPHGDEHAHEAVLELPDPDAANGWGVLLIGGGYVTDAAWTVPGSAPDGDRVIPITIDGTPTTDARTIGAALADAGFVVMRWSGIPQSQHAPAPPPPFPHTIDMTRRALAGFRDVAGDRVERVAFVGHSLGAARACVVADQTVGAMVFLAGAYVSPTHVAPATIASGALADRPGLDADADTLVTRDELARWPGLGADPALAQRPWDELDLDADGHLRAWEVAAGVRDNADATSADLARAWGEPRWGPELPSDAIERLGIPVLALCAGRDPISIHGPWLMASGLAEVRFLPGLGHRLGEERDGLVGPIDPGVVRQIVEWLSARAEGTMPAEGL